MKRASDNPRHYPTSNDKRSQLTLAKSARGISRHDWPP
jgi:hypothetical protein